MPAAVRAFALAALLSLILAAPAQAGLATPTPVAPANGLAVDALPAFSWAAVKNADRYEFQLAADSGMNSPVLGRGEDQFTTRNTRATLKKTVPNGTYWWRVRAIAKDGTPSSWSAPRAIVKSWTSAPALQSPANSAIMVHPTHPLVLRWSPVRLAAKYIVSIGTDPTLGTIVNPKDETSATVYAPRATLLPPGTYYWNVTPIDAQNHRGAPSPVQSFMWTWPTTTATRVDDLMAAPEVYDSHFSWDPIAGAARYELEVNSSVDFATGSKVCCSNPVVGTSYSPTVVFRDNTYYWRVRALDASGNAGLWNAGPSFTKTFDKVPPVPGSSIKNMRMRDNLADPGTDTEPGTPGYQTEVPVLRWDPVPGAASYEVNVTRFTAGTCDWTSANQWRVKTSVPAWTPLGSGWSNIKPYPDLMQVANEGTVLAIGGSYCTRVRARADRDAGLNEVYGDYTYLDDGTGPAFTFTGYPTPDPCGGCNYLASGDYVLPVTGTSSTRTPLFTWKPLDGKQSYYVLVAKDPSFSNIVDYGFTQVPAYAPRNLIKPTTYPDETTSYFWAVLPATNANGTGAVGNPLLASPSSFQKQSTPASLTGPASAAGVDLQPTFRWTPVEGARRYRLQVATDPTFGGLLDDVLTDSTAYTSNTSYPADTVLYWRVRADDENLIGLTWSATGSFQRKLATPVPSSTNPTSGESIPLWSWSPVTGAVSYDVAADEPDGDHSEFTDFRSAAFTAIKMTGTGVFGWRVRAVFPKPLSVATQPGPWSGTTPFTRTIGEPGGAKTEVSGASILLSWNAKPGAKNYHVQVSQRADFLVNIDDVTTDNLSFAPTLTHALYMAGGTFWWRVAAQDEDRNQGDFSAAQRFVLPKTSGGVTRLTRLGLTLRVVKTKKGRRLTVTVKANRRAARGALVRVFSAGVTPRKLKTNRFGKATFKVKKLGRGKRLMRRQLLVHAAKTGFLPASKTIKIRY